MEQNYLKYLSETIQNLANRIRILENEIAEMMERYEDRMDQLRTNLTNLENVVYHLSVNNDGYVEGFIIEDIDCKYEDIDNSEYDN